MERHTLEEERRLPITPEVQETLWRQVKDNPYMQDLNMEILKLERGYVQGRMRVTERLLNPYGSVHGGCLFSLADVMAGLAACTYGMYSSTVDGHMEYILPAMDTEYILCEAKEVRQGMHVSQYEALLYDDRGQLVDKAAFSFYMMHRAVAPSKTQS